jgi:hypothetical protein
MKFATIVMATVLLPGATASPATAGRVSQHAAPDGFIVCQRPHRNCRLVPGTDHRFDRLFGAPRALTGTGVLGVWRPVRIIRRHRR